jgi:acyl-homoserine-lactone acylase
VYLLFACPATMDIKALEEWYRMNKAKNFTEFYHALSMTSLPMFNIDLCRSL